MSVSWIAKGAGYYVDSSGRYQICLDEGTWVLMSTHSLVRHFSTLREAKRSAEEVPVTGFDECGPDWRAIAKGQVIRGDSGWVILYRPQNGVWREVAGPYPTRCQARHVKDIARQICQQESTRRSCDAR